MPRFYCPDLTSTFAGKPDAGVVVTLDDAESHHARRVLRLEAGEAVELFDGKGTLVTGEIVNDGRSRAVPGAGVGVMVRSHRHIPAMMPWVDVAAAIPKGDRADQMVEGLSQVGASRLIPLLSARSVVNPGPGKIERFFRGSIESAKQCGRPWLMEVTPPQDLLAVLAGVHDLKLLASPLADPTPATLSPQFAKAQRILVLIGPEGGWTEVELAQAGAAGCVAWRLGPHVMRIETAAVAAVAILRAG